jgi:ABC-type lipoprotein release transport system permease subunit
MGSLAGLVDSEEMEILDWRTMVPELIQAIELDNISGIIMLLLLYSVIGFGMLGTFMMMTSERMYEFGVVIALGMKRWKLQAIVFLEITLLSLLGVVVGFAISLPVISYFYRNPIYLPGDYGDSFEKFDIEPVYAFSLDPVIFYSQTWLVFIMAIVLSSYPMIKIIRLNPVIAMREG